MLRKPESLTVKCKRKLKSKHLYIYTGSFISETLENVNFVIVAVVAIFLTNTILRNFEQENLGFCSQDIHSRRLKKAKFALRARGADISRQHTQTKCKYCF